MFICAKSECRTKKLFLNYAHYRNINSVLKSNKLLNNMTTDKTTLNYRQKGKIK